MTILEEMLQIMQKSDSLKKAIEVDPWTFLGKKPKPPVEKEMLCPHGICDGGGIMYGGTPEEPTEKRCLCNEPCDDMDDDSDDLTTNLK